MLHYIRDRAQGWLAWFIVGLITIPFALWGVNSYFTGPSDTVVAEINGNDISQNDLQQAMQQYRDRMRNALGDQFDAAMFTGTAAKRTVLEGLIDERLIRDATIKLNQKISDQDVASMIASIPAFQTEGKFDQERYLALVARMGLSATQYENRLRRDMASQQLTSNVGMSNSTLSYQMTEALRLEKQERELAYGVILMQPFTEQVDVIDADVKAYFDAHQENYTAPEQMKVDYLELSLDSLAEGLNVTDEQLKQYYADNQSRYVRPEERRVSHILIEGDDDDALKTIETVQQKLAAGEAFEDLAKEYSQDVGSASNGGDLGFFAPGVMDPVVEEAAYALQKEGDISDVLKTEFGYQLIKLTGIKKDESQPFAAVRDEVEKHYRHEQAEQQFYDKAEQLASLTYENPDSLDIAAETLGLTVQTSPNFTKQGAENGVASNKQVIEAAFAPDVKDDGLNSEVIELSETHVVVIRENKYTPEAVLPYDSVAPAIKQQLVFEKASAKAESKGQQLLEQLKANADVDTSAFDDWHEAAFYARDNSDLSQQVLQRAFAMPVPSKSTPVYQGFTAENGNYIVIKLSAVKDGDTSAVTDEEREQLKQNLTTLYSQAELAAFMATLRANADVEINESAL